MCTASRRRLFERGASVEIVLGQIRHAAAEHAIENIAYCFMPDHVHMLVAGTSEVADLRKFAALSKQRSAWRFSRQGGGRLWQPGYYDRVLRDEDATMDVVRYIVENPVRARLVAEPSQYEFWGSGTYTRDQLLDYIQDARPWRWRRA
jgi:putative transposase